MCGICGFTGMHEEKFTHTVLPGMMKALVHRGPDKRGKDGTPCDYFYAMMYSAIFRKTDKRNYQLFIF